MSKLKGDLLKSTSGRTPYEVRLEVLHLAQHIVEDKAQRQLAYLQAQNDFLISQQDLKGDPETLLANIKNTVDQMEMPALGVEEVLKNAKKLNKFISEG
jgi:hypothetical protein